MNIETIRLTLVTGEEYVYNLLDAKMKEEEYQVTFTYTDSGFGGTGKIMQDSFPYNGIVRIQRKGTK